MPTLRPAQSAAVKAVSFQPKLLLADVGAGKTAAALRSLRLRAQTYGRKRTLVVGTKRICDMVWGPEVALWTPEFHYASAAGPNAKKRMETLTNPLNDIVGINFQNLIWLAKEFGENLHFMFPWIIIDESSKLENPASKSFQAIKPLLPTFEWRLPMTGTPRANHLHDLWGSVYLADCGEALGNYREAFLQRWFFPIQKASLEWVPKPGAEAEIYERVKGLVHRMPFTSPEPVEIDLVLPLNGKVKDLNQRIDESIAADDTKTILGSITFATNGNRSYTKQLQLSSGAVYDDDGEVWRIHEDKLDALSEIVAEAKGEPMMVVYQFKHELDAILDRFPQAQELTDEKVLADWNAGLVELLLVHPLSCGHGLNAQHSGCALQVWFTPTPDAELYTQTIGRINRPGNPHTVRVIRLIMQGTKDRACYLVVAARRRGEVATLDMFE
jgi:SNF2 family DNA or RNA helicase